MLKGSMKAVVIYRREWSKSSDGGVAKTPFYNWSKTISRNRTLMSISNFTQCCLCLLSTIYCFAFEWLFQSLWSRQQRCKMAAARDIYMKTLNGSNTSCNCDECYIFGRCWCRTIHMDRLGSFDTDLFYWVKDSNLGFVAEIKITQSALWQSSLCVFLLSVPC